MKLTRAMERLALPEYREADRMLRAMERMEFQAQETPVVMLGGNGQGPQTIEQEMEV